jgi:hypothetical protein
MEGEPELVQIFLAGASSGRLHASNLDDGACFDRPSRNRLPRADIPTTIFNVFHLFGELVHI